MDQRFEIAFQHAIDIAQREPAAQILDHAVRRQHIVADLAAEVDLQLRVFGLARFRALLFEFVLE